MPKEQFEALEAAYAALSNPDVHPVAQNHTTVRRASSNATHTAHKHGRRKPATNAKVARTRDGSTSSRSVEKVDAHADTLQDLLARNGARGKGVPTFFNGRWRLGLVSSVALMVILSIFLRNSFASNQPRYITGKVEVGAMSVSIFASGTLKPTRAVDVGSELSGMLEAVLVRENDRVEKGQLLAQLDTSRLNDAALKSHAAVVSAEARVAQMETTLAENRANLARMRQVAKLTDGKVPARTELESATATVKRAEANLKSAQAEVAQARALLKTDETNIRKATITSPVDGVVLSRKVEPGQTVVAAMTTPVLFNIAEDLTQMELHVNVDEADVAQVTAGQEASFTVSAWNNRKFPARVARVDLGSTMTDNVVTYTTVLEVGNDDLALRPGMTASVEILTAPRDKALLIPSAALHFSPIDNTVSSVSNDQNLLSRIMPRFPAPGKRAEKGADTQVWVLENGRPHAIQVKTGMSDGRFTEILGGDLRVGMLVITDQETPPSVQ
ncbi:MAG: efflux RND transporter periplasmic adaptor subunit [Azoarcus sp.]|nr:efflux RND transporter periplasmic adaptor subunit [Azoarcus sp.]